jgi:hypothetical protein
MTSTEPNLVPAVQLPSGTAVVPDLQSLTGGL